MDKVRITYIERLLVDVDCDNFEEEYKKTIIKEEDFCEEGVFKELIDKYKVRLDKPILYPWRTEKDWFYYAESENKKTGINKILVIRDVRDFE